MVLDYVMQIYKQSISSSLNIFIQTTTYIYIYQSVKIRTFTEFP